MRHVATALGIALLASCASTSYTAQRPPLNPPLPARFDVFAGVRSLDHHDWAPVEDQGTIGVQFAYEPPDAPAGVELGLFASGDEEDDARLPGGGTVDVKGETSEFSIGLRKTFVPDEGTVHPYLGGGLTYIRAKVELGGLDDEDGSAGFYFHAGVGFDLGPSFQVGFDMRFVAATDVDLFGTDGSADYGQLAVFIGVRF
jgi:opacity protein-like surface antigen